MLEKVTVTDIIFVSTVYSPKGRVFNMEKRSNYGLSFCKSGQITYTHKGNNFVSDINHAVILPKNAEYSLHGDKTGDFPIINFECNGLNIDDFLVFELKNPESYLVDFERLNRLFLLGGNRPKQFSIFYNMLSRLSADKLTPENPLFNVGEYIEKHFDSLDLTNKGLAEVCGISEAYFRKLFPEYFGTTPKQYVLEIRMRKAKQLLEGSKQTVTQVAEKCGFSNIYYFCRAFKGYTGLTPSEYRRENQKIGL
ncbi:MAG: helix-turn-helix transcriptional regulator [Clostridia bacterium]|nr:helix-turn-helix transcriptional regulator [Clostridia bacterium]